MITMDSMGTGIDEAFAPVHAHLRQRQSFWATLREVNAGTVREHAAQRESPHA